MPISENFGLNYSDFWEGHQENFTGQVQECTRTILCNWADRPRLMIDFLGFSERVGQRGIRRTLPNKHPQYDWLHATQCVVQPQAMGIPSQDGPEDFIFYGFVADIDYSCKMVVTYQYLDYEVTAGDESEGTGDLDRFVSRYETLATESLPIPGHTMKLVSATAGFRTEIKEPVAKHSGIITARYVWHVVPAVPRNSILSLIGKVNDSLFDARPARAGRDAFDGYAAETLLFIGADWKEGHSPSRHIQYEIEYTFLWRGVGNATWNKIYRKTGPGGVGGPDYYAVSSDGTASGTPMYALGTLTNLFILDAP